MSGDIIDSELLSLQNRLKNIQKEIGGAKEKHMGGTHDGKMDRFLDLFGIMEERLEAIRHSIDEIRKLERVPGAQPTELINHQSRVRSELNQLGDEYKELEMLQRLESKKRRSRHSPEELKERQGKVVFMAESIQEIQDIQRAGYNKTYTSYRVVKMEDSEMFKQRDIEMGPMTKNPDGTMSSKTAPTRGVYGQRNNNMTDMHRLQLMRIKERDEQVDLAIDEIGQGVDVLHEIARTANEEVKLQNTMLDTLESKVMVVQDHVLNLNETMKETLDKARKSDKICMDIFCIMILVGMIIVLYKLSTANEKKQ